MGSKSIKRSVKFDLHRKQDRAKFNGRTVPVDRAPMSARANASQRAERQSRQNRLLGIELAARNAFAKNGYDRTSIAEIAAGVGVAEATIYKYYPSKRHLLITVLRRWYREMLAVHRAKISGVKGVRERLYILIWQHLKVIEDSPDLCQLFYSEVRSQEGYRDSEIYALNREVTGLLIEVLKEGAAEGSLRPDIPFRLVRDIIFGGIEHHLSAYLVGRDQLDCDRLATSLTDIVFNGVGAASSSSSAADMSIKQLNQVTKRLERAVRKLEGS